MVFLSFKTIIFLEILFFSLGDSSSSSSMYDFKRDLERKRAEAPRFITKSILQIIEATNYISRLISSYDKGHIQNVQEITIIDSDDPSEIGKTFQTLTDLTESKIYTSMKYLDALLAQKNESFKYYRSNHLIILKNYHFIYFSGLDSKIKRLNAIKQTFKSDSQKYLIEIFVSLCSTWEKYYHTVYPEASNSNEKETKGKKGEDDEI